MEGAVSGSLPPLYNSFNYKNCLMFDCEKFNKCHKESLPSVMTPHTMPHTFCTRMANAGMNPKALQYHHGPFQHHYDAELLRPRHIPFRPRGNGQTGSQGGNQSGKYGETRNCRLVVGRYFTTSSTTFDRENTRGYESICEVLPI